MQTRTIRLSPENERRLMIIRQAHGNCSGQAALMILLALGWQAYEQQQNQAPAAPNGGKW